MASRFAGLEFEPEEPALVRAIPEAWNSGVDTVVLIAHECPDKLEPIVARHPEWHLAFVGAGHCHKAAEKRVGDVPIIAPGWRMRGYARVRLGVDRARPVGQRVVSVESAVVEVARPEASPPVASTDEIMRRSVAHYEGDLNRALGEAIGYTKTGLDDSRELGRWVAEAWRRALRTDVAVVNSGGIRQGIPKGAIKLSSVYSVMPFDNKLVVCRLTGRALVENLKNDEAIAAGVSKAGPDRYVDAAGRAIVDDKTYTVATIDFLYFGGADFTFQKHDPAANDTGIDWRNPFIEWAKQQRSGEKDPLERRMR
jgi:2',3'-cyclic-nucleotide 2'-phosphodiesterase (5'-nucleotidase family)